MWASHPSLPVFGEEKGTDSAAVSAVHRWFFLPFFPLSSHLRHLLMTQEGYNVPEWPSSSAADDTGQFLSPCFILLI